MFPLNWSDPYINKNGTRARLSEILGDIPGIQDEIDGLDSRLDTAEGNIDDIADSITPISQTGTKATAAITAGDYFYLNGALVKATTNIAIDDTFTSGTNYSAVSGGLNDLESQIGNINNDIIKLGSSIAASPEGVSITPETWTLVATREITESGKYLLLANVTTPVTVTDPFEMSISISDSSTTPDTGRQRYFKGNNGAVLGLAYATIQANESKYLFVSHKYSSNVQVFPLLRTIRVG